MYAVADESDSEIENVSIGTPPEILHAAATASDKLLPQKSRSQYERAYNLFMDWRRKKQTISFSENVLLAYFQELSAKMKPSSLWAIYFMLRMTINVKHNINVSKYAKLCAFLKRTSDGYKPKKSKTLTPQQIEEFLTSAPDENFLFTKVGLIFGIMGACRRKELWKIETTHVQDMNTALLVHIPDTKTKTERQFVIGDSFYKICKKYMELRPPNVGNNRFFLNYQRGKCTKQAIGINEFGNIPSQIATFLNLPNPTSYKGHCMRRSSATILVDSGADITALKRHGGWRSTTVAEGYIDTSINNKMKTAKKIGDAVQGISSATVTSNFDINDEIREINSQNGSDTNINMNNIMYEASGGILENTHFGEKRLISFSNCQNVSNITVNVYLPK